MPLPDQDNISAGDFTVICAPGWACTAPLSSWLSLPVRTVSHLEQAPYLLGEGDASALVPEGRWGLLTWSMGSWTGTLMSRSWSGNPPVFWLALSPFADLIGGGALVSAQAHRVLCASFEKDPVATVDFFIRRNGGSGDWFREEDVAANRGIFARTLRLLGGPGPRPAASLRTPILAVHGAEDRLVSGRMAADFARFSMNGETVSMETLGHAMLYEEPPKLLFAAARLREALCGPR